MKLLAGFLVGSKRFFVVSILASAVVAMADVVNPQIIRYTVDVLLGNGKSSLPEFAERIVTYLGGKDVLAKNLWMVSIAVMVVAVVSALSRYSRAASISSNTS